MLCDIGNGSDLSMYRLCGDETADRLMLRATRSRK